MSFATSSSSTLDAVQPRSDVAAPRRSRVNVYMELTKARLSTLVVLTTAVGFALAASTGVDWMLLMVTVIGTALAAASAAVLNQVIEVKRDQRMHRTRNRPLPAGDIGLKRSFTLAVVMGYLGVGLLAGLVNLTAAWLALLTIVLYVVIYTPMKTRSTLNTIVGAVCGALPPVIGWVAVRGSEGLFDTGAWVLFAILFIWQLPHFLALAWLYREDYARGGFVMLPLLDPRGEITARVLVVTSLMLLPLGMIATTAGLAGWVFLFGSVVLALWMTGLSMRFYMQRSDTAARKVFLASIVYLSVLLGLFVLDRGPVQNIVPGSAAVAQVVDH
jgi:protoheme IX farnesyltransferase